MANVPDTFEEYTGDGSTTSFSFGFDYLEDSDVFVEVDGTAVAFTVTAPGQVELDTAPATDAAIVILRRTDVAAIEHDFAGGTPFILRFADANWEQVLYSAQEAQNIAKAGFDKSRLNEALKATSFAVVNDDLYPSVQAVADYVAAGGGGNVSAADSPVDGSLPIWKSPNLIGTATPQEARDALSVYSKSEVYSRSESITPLSDITDIADLNPAALVDGQQFSMTGWRTGSDLGGGDLYYDSTRPQTDHDGGTVFALGAMPPTDFNDPAQIAAYLNAGSGLSGNGCLVRKPRRTIDVTCYGALPGVGNELTASVRAALDFAGSNSYTKIVTVPAGDWYVDTHYLKRGVTLLGAGRGVTNFYQIRLPTVQGMTRADKANDASDSGLFGVSYYGNGQVPGDPALLKAVVFEEVKNFECGHCDATNFSSYGFWAHTNADAVIADLCTDGFFHDLETTNVEHAFEAKRGKDIRWLRCVANGDEQYSESAFHPWERCENIRYEECEAYGNFATGVINTTSSPSFPGNNKDLYFDVYVRANNEENLPTGNRAGRIYAAENITIKGDIESFQGFLWGGNSGDLTLDVDMTCTLSPISSPANEVITGNLYGRANIKQSRALGVGLLGAPALEFDQSGQRLQMDSLIIDWSADSGIPLKLANLDQSSVASASITSNGRTMRLDNMTLTVPDLSAVGQGTDASVYLENSTLVTKVTGSTEVEYVAGYTGSELNLLPGSNIRSRVPVTLNGSSLRATGAELIADPGGQDLVAHAIGLDATSSANVSGGLLAYQNAGSLSTSNELIESVDGSYIKLDGVKLESDQTLNDIIFRTANTMVTDCDSSGSIQFSIAATANKSMFTGNIVDVATSDNSTGSMVTEIVR